MVDQTELAHAPPFDVAGLRFTPAAGTVTDVNGRSEPLQPQAMRVMAALVAAEGATLSRSDLRRLCWSGRTVGDDAIDRVVGRIRQVDRALGPAFVLETIPKVGYRLVSSQETVGPPPDHEPPAEEDSTNRESPSPEQSVTHDRRWVLGAIAAAGAAGVGLTAVLAGLRNSGRASSDGLAIYVGPVRTAAGDRAAAALADTIVHDCRVALARIDGVRIAVSDDEADAALDAFARARRAGATLVTSGLAHTVDGQVRLGLDLSRASGQLLATTTRTMPIRSNAGAEGSLIGAVIEKVAGLVDPASVTQPQATRPRDPVVVKLVDEADRRIMLAREQQMIGDNQACQHTADEALAQVQRALSVDPRDAKAFVALATLTRNGWPGAFTREPRTAMQRVGAAREIVRAALVSEPNDPAALTAVADDYRRYQWRWTEAENLLRRSLQSDPALADTHWSYAYMLGTEGRGIEGLRHAEMLQSLAPEYTWRRVALPRLLYITGRWSEAWRIYHDELRRAPANAFLLRELYFCRLSEGDADALRDLARRAASGWTGRSVPPPIARLIARANAAAGAVEGRTRDFREMIDRDVTAYDAPRLGPQSTLQGRASIDLPFIFAMELAWAGNAERSLDYLERSIAARSLYWPSSLPYGPTEFPPNVSRHPRYAAIWRSDVRLVELMATRREALRTGQMAARQAVR